MIRPPVTLPPAEPRCPDTRAKPCSSAGSCARALVAADQGRPLRDFSPERNQWLGCPGYLPASAYRATKAAGPTVHDAPEGLC